MQTLTAPGAPMRTAGDTSTVVLAAVDDDACCAAVLARAWAEAARLRLPMRVVHVWDERRIGPRGVRTGVADSDRQLSRWVYENVPEDVAATVERQVLHDDSPARALGALSRHGVLLVVGAGSSGSAGRTARGLAGHTRCPLVIVPPGSSADDELEML